MLAALMLLFGCGEDPPAPRDQTLVAALGDSITAGSPLWDSNPAVRETMLGLDQRSQFQYWASERRPELEFRSCGVLGQRTDEILTRFEDCIRGTEALIVQGGINDIAQGYPLERSVENLRLMVRKGKRAGLGVILVNVLPWNNGYPATVEPILELNRQIDELGKREDVEVLDFYEELEDPQTDGLMAPTLTDDGDHPSIAGYKRLGALVAPAL